ncbi:hypothetical protein AHF37_02672 [Paragonimus kellicotti]|nr:hypothetical protein AHF37_02672 [Paragonimus kellicotti]
MTRTVTAVNRLINLMSSDGSMNRIFKAIQAVSVTDKCLTCRFQVTKPETNSLETLHGAYIAGVVDFISSVDLVAHGHLKHVTVTMGIECFRPGPYESWVKVDSYILNKGKRLAFCDVRFTEEATGKLLARGSHTKFLISD